MNTTYDRTKINGNEWIKSDEGIEHSAQWLADTHYLPETNVPEIANSTAVLVISSAFGGSPYDLARRIIEIRNEREEGDDG